MSRKVAPTSTMSAFLSSKSGRLPTASRESPLAESNTFVKDARVEKDVGPSDGIDPAQVASIEPPTDLRPTSGNPKARRV